jgi:uncharacterized protein (TIGR02246 family)
VSNYRLCLGFLCSALCLSSIVGCSPETGDHGRLRASARPADTRAADGAAIRAASAAWSRASFAMDIDRGISFYTEDAVQMDPKTPAVKGRENIRKLWTQMPELPGAGVSFQTTSVEVARSGDLAYETGTYDFVTTDNMGTRKDERWKYVVVWKKQGDGSWKAAVDIDNSDQ